MNTKPVNGDSGRIEIRPWKMAAGTLFLLLTAFSGANAAQNRPAKSASLVPVAAPATAPQGGIRDTAQTRVEQIGAGDMVRITVFRNPDLTTEAKVSDRGSIMFPLVGEVQLSGLTPAQAGSRIAESLKKGKFVVNPEVTVALAQVNSRQVSVLGNVNRPGRYPLDATTGKLTDLIALAGGIAETGSDQVTLVTNRNGEVVKTEIDVPAMLRDGNLDKNVELQAGDTIFVHRAPMVYIYGEVQRAGAYRVEKDMTVMQALALGGGLTPRGTERGIRIHRKNGDGQVHRFEAKLHDPVRTDDVIYVRESFF